jgi:5-methylcytosine-specific restriction endonuclease McrA
MGLFDDDYDLITGKKKKTDAQKRRSALTAAKKDGIKFAVGHKCEKCGQKRKLQIDHIKEVKKGGRNIGSNLVALCGSCHYEKFSQTEMKKAISKRSAKAKAAITAVLKDRKKVSKPKKKDPFAFDFKL